MNYNPVLELEQKGCVLDKGVLLLAHEFLEKSSDFLQVQPGSIDVRETIVRESFIKFLCHINGLEYKGEFSFSFNENNILNLSLKGYCQTIELKIDPSFNIIRCKIAFKDNFNSDMRFLKFDKQQDENVLKINYYDFVSTDWVFKIYEKEEDTCSVPSENLFAYNGLLPDRETVVTFDSQEKLKNIIKSFCDDAVVTERDYRGDFVLLKMQKYQRSIIDKNL